MKIKKIKFVNHPILKNKEFLFFNEETNEVYNTILIAGENGAGKTALLDFLNNIYLLFEKPSVKFDKNKSSQLYSFYESTSVEIDILDEQGNEYNLTSEPADLFDYPG
jgi:predicted ATP-binding protein involved in virulence